MESLRSEFKIYNEDTTIIGLNNELKAMYSSFCLQKTNENIVFVTNTLYEANRLYQYISNYTDNILLFPMDDFLTSEALAISPELKIKRLETLIQSLNDDKNIIVTNLMGYLRFLPSWEIFNSNIINLKKGDTSSPTELVNKLVSAGYERESLVNKTGEFALRGFIIDIYPVGYDNPVRIEFFGDEIDELRIFDVNSQKSTKKIEELTIYPNTEDLCDSEIIINDHYELDKHIKTVNISEFVNAKTIMFNNHNNIIQGYKTLCEEISDYKETENVEKDIKYMKELEEIKVPLSINFTSFDEINEGVVHTQNYEIKEINDVFSGIDSINKILNQYIKDKNTVIVCLSNRYKMINLEEGLNNKNVIITNAREIFPGKINLINKKIIDSFKYNNLIIISEQTLFNSKQNDQNYKSKFNYGTKIKDIAKLNIGDYVVHAMNGIGRYLGLKTLVKNGLKKDYLQIEYKDGDKLYIPVEKIELINKYSSGEGVVPKINKLGGTEWQKTKLRVRKKIEDIAQDLLKLYALRENTPGFAFDKDNDDQIQFEKSFPYTETADQMKVTEEIKKDMEKARPMDRLLCGDVGYGKTEVAFRAMFKAVLSGKQVALLCPTTILSNQHYINALERFKDYPVNIALLNRFVTAKKVTEIKKKLIDGKIDILIGTHRILSDDIEFKDLGLLVIDEEQRFGVKHKEKIQHLKTNVDVLTLSATPIPRTLQMSMSGVKSLSLIETPPVDRYPIQTYVLAENNQIIKDAIYKELARDGQVFILYNNILDMEQKKGLINSLVPEAKVVTAHGKMDKTELENIMIDFTNRKYDVMLCTTIIETGIDIPNVNTLIVIDADRFGLSQLYQLRGRVGRSNKIAYCYLMYDRRKILTDVAEKRLKAIKEFTELGSGFAIAMRDLSIRGAGDILGSEQAGFVDAIGIEMFLKLLDDEINRLKGIEVEEKEESNVPLVEVSTSIDDNYVADEDIKIYIHQRINEIDSVDSLKDVEQELTDRFGKLDESIIIYMYEELFERMATKLRITNIKQTKNFIEVWLPLDLTNNVKGDSLFLDVTKLSRMFRFTMRGKQLVIILDTVKLDKHFIYYLIDLMKLIENNKKS